MLKKYRTSSAIALAMFASLIAYSNNVNADEVSNNDLNNKVVYNDDTNQDVSSNYANTVVMNEPSSIAEAMVSGDYLSDNQSDLGHEPTKENDVVEPSISGGYSYLVDGASNEGNITPVFDEVGVDSVYQVGDKQITVDTQTTSYPQSQYHIDTNASDSVKPSERVIIDSLYNDNFLKIDTKGDTLGGYITKNYYSGMSAHEFNQTGRTIRDNAQTELFLVTTVDNHLTSVVGANYNPDNQKALALFGNDKDKFDNSSAIISYYTLSSIASGDYWNTVAKSSEEKFELTYIIPDAIFADAKAEYLRAMANDARVRARNSSLANDKNYNFYIDSAKMFYEAIKNRYNNYKTGSATITYIVDNDLSVSDEKVDQLKEEVAARIPFKHRQALGVILVEGKDRVAKTNFTGILGAVGTPMIINLNGTYNALLTVFHESGHVLDFKSVYKPNYLASKDRGTNTTQFSKSEPFTTAFNKDWKDGQGGSYFQNPVEAYAQTFNYYNLDNVKLLNGKDSSETSVNYAKNFIKTHLANGTTPYQVVNMASKRQKEAEEKAKQEAAKKAAEEKAKKEAEEKAKQEASKKAAEEKAKKEAEEKAKQEEAKRKAAEEKAKKEAEEKAKQEEAKRKAEEEAKRKAAEEKAKQEAAKKAAEEKAKQEAAKKAAEEKAKQEEAKRKAEEKAKQEAAKKEAEKKAAEEKAKQEEAKRKAQEEKAKQDSAYLSKLAVHTLFNGSKIALDYNVDYGVNKVINGVVVMGAKPIVKETEVTRKSGKKIRQISTQKYFINESTGRLNSTTSVVLLRK